MRTATTRASAPAGAHRARRRRRVTLLGVVHEVGLSLITAGVVIVLFVVYQLFGTVVTEEHGQAALSSSFHRSVAAVQRSGGTGTAPAGSSGDQATVGGAPAGDLSPSTPTGVAVDHLVIPSIGVDKFVVQGTGEAQLMEGPGHYVGTPFPGQPGNVGIAGHRTTYGAPFYRLGDLRSGSMVYLTDTAGRTFDYRVARSEVVAPTDVSVLAPSHVPELTLTTCNPVYSDTSRLVVVALLVGRPQPAPASSARPAATGPAAPGPSAPRPAATATLTTGDGAEWPAAAGFGALALAIWILTRVAIARTRRWARVGAFIAGVAVAAVPLWWCFQAVARLLPASF